MVAAANADGDRSRVNTPVTERGDALGVPELVLPGASDSSTHRDVHRVGGARVGE